MALTDDQRAMLQLLLERDHSYDDLAGVLGIERAEVRRRARAALSELAGRDPDRDVALSDYMLGEADPISRADVVRQLQSDPDSLALAKELAAKLTLVAPEAELPELPEGKAKRRAAREPAAQTDGAADAGPRARTGTMTSSQSRLLVILGASAVLLVAIVLAVAGVFSGDDEPSEPTAQATTEGGGAATEDGTRVVLESTSGGNGRGLVALGFTGNDQSQAVVEGALEGLPKPDKDHVYLLWFLNDENDGFFLLQPLPVEDNGSATFQAPISEELFPLIQDARFIDIASLDRDQLRSAVQSFRDALENREDSLSYIGESLLRGEIPRTDSGA